MSEYLRSVIMLTISTVAMLVLLVSAIRLPILDGYVFSGLLVAAFINMFTIIVNAIRVFKA